MPMTTRLGANRCPLSEAGLPGDGPAGGVVQLDRMVAINTRVTAARGLRTLDLAHPMLMRLASDRHPGQRGVEPACVLSQDVALVLVSQVVSVGEDAGAVGELAVPVRVIR